MNQSFDPVLIAKEFVSWPPYQLRVITMTNSNSRGSEWRIWDLHVHTPASYGGTYEEFIEKAQKTPAAVIGINDYCTISGYEEIVRLGSIPGKTIFPVVELRMNNLLQTKKNPNGIKINFHVIFDNDPEIFIKIKTWISSVKCFDEKGEQVQLGAMPDKTKASFDFDAVVDDLKRLGLYETHSLIWLPYDEYGGIDEIDPVSDGYFKLSLINKAHIMGSSTKKQIEFFKWQDPKFEIADYEKWFDKPKPCIKGSDAHKNNYPYGCLQNHQSQPIDKFCWINADMTFEGLKQIVIEPERVFIGDEPSLNKRVRDNKTKFIRSLEIDKIAGQVLDDTWFEKFNVELNSGLVAIIGNKGGGKSAITDILSLCGNTYQDPANFSFLTNSKFRRVKPLNLSEKFEATLTWEDDTKTTKRLSTNPDKNLPERVKYIPQNFLERLCTNVDSDDFEKELKQIIYSHTPNDKRLGKASLDELINYKSDLVNNEVSQIQADISKLNLRIVELETKATAEHKKLVENQLKLKQGELFAHDGTKPIKPQDVEQNEEEQKKAEELNQLRKNIKDFELELQEVQKKKGELTLQKEELNRAIHFYNGIDEQLKKTTDSQNEFVQVLSKNSIDPNKIFSFKVDTLPIVELVGKIDNEISEIDKQLDTAVADSKASKLNVLKVKLQTEQEELDKPAKAP